MKHLGAVLVMLLAVAACKSEAEKMCADAAAPVKMRVSACGEACDSGNGEACKIQTDVALQACMKDKQAEICRWMCDYAKTGQDLYCKEHQAITGKPAQ